MTATFARRVKALKYANSYTRMGALLALRTHPDFWSFVRKEWSGCDNIADYRRVLVAFLQAHQKRHGFAILEAMDDEACAMYDELPESVTVWRGCYSNNVRGISWTLDRAVAVRFPFLSRYRQNCAADRALLIQGRIRKDRIAFLVTDRRERSRRDSRRCGERRPVARL